MTSRPALISLALTTALVTAGCTLGDDDPTAAASASATPSVRATLAAPVPSGLVSATYRPARGGSVDALIARLNKLPGVLGAGYFASEASVTVRLKPDATKAQIDAVVDAIRKEPTLSDVVFEPPEPTAGPSPTSTQTASSPKASPKPSATAY